MMIWLTQPGGGRHESGGVAVFTRLGVIEGVEVSMLWVEVSVAGSVSVAVIGTGDGNILLVGVGVGSGLNSTSEIDKAPMINPMEMTAVTSALPNSRKLRIISFL
jgi:hypothetical protein